MLKPISVFRNATRAIDFSRIAILVALAVSLLLPGESKAGIYTGPTDSATFTSLMDQVQTKRTALTNKMAEANLAGVNTDYAQVSLTTIGLFKDVYAPYDRTNAATIQTLYAANTWKSQNDPVGPVGLPFDELADCIEIADAAISELQAQINGTIILKNPPDFSTGAVALNGTHYTKSGKTVIPYSFFWHPFNEDIMKAYGRQGEGYYSIQDMQSTNTPYTSNKNNLVNKTASQAAANRSPIQFFLGHQLASTTMWQKTSNPEVFNVGDRVFTDYDIDNPLTRTWLDGMFTNLLTPAAAAAGSTERVHMLANEPTFWIREGGAEADNGVSTFTYDKYKIWLQNKYGSIAALNSVYGTSFADFSAVRNTYTIPLPVSYQGGPVWYDWCRFNMDRVNDWFGYLNTRVRTADPNGRNHVKVLGEMAIHYGQMDSGVDIELVSKMMDLPGADSQVIPARAEYYQPAITGTWKTRYAMEWTRQGAVMDFIKSICPEKAYYDSEWHGLSGSRWRDFHMEPAHVRSSLWLSCTQGLSMLKAWVWCRYDGTEPYPAGVQNGQPRSGSDFFGECATQPLQLDAWGRTMKEINAHGDEVASLVPTRRNYIIYYNRDAAIQDPAYPEALREVYEALKLLNIPVGFTTPSELSKVTGTDQTLIIPPTTFIPNAELAALQAFATGGGKIVVVNSALNFSKTELGVSRPGGAGFTPFASIAKADAPTMTVSFQTALAPRKPALPMSFATTTTAGSPAYGVLCNQTQNPVGSGQTFSLINVSKDVRVVTVSAQSGGTFTLRNLITGQPLPSATITMNPQDVLLLSTSAPVVLPPVTYLVNDDFSQPTLNATVWNTGGGFALNTTHQNVLLSTNGTSWGSKGDSTGAAGLNSTVGYASFTVAANGATALGGNFIVGNTTNFNTSYALVNISFATGGPGIYEVLWNNSAVAKPFTMPISGWSGTLAAGATVWIANGNSDAPVFGSASAAANVSPGQAANRFGFWINQSTQAALIDNVRIANTLGAVATTPPVPTGLTATPGNAQVSLAWASSAGTTSYNVKRATTSGGPYTTIASPTTPGFTDTSTTNGTTYYYVVSAINGGSPQSANSTQASATPQPLAPVAPTNLIATPGNAQVSLSWSASAGATNYNVKRTTVSGGSYTIIASPSTSGFTDTSTTNGTTYYYVVSATNGGSPQSADTAQASATPQPPAPSTPANLTATAGNSQITLNWNTVAGATSYNVKRSTVSGGPYAIIASPGTPDHTDTTAANGTTYYYVVSAANGGGESANSTLANATPQAPLLPAPVDVVASAGNARITLNWSPVSGADSYTIKRSTTPGGPYSPIANPLTNNHTDTAVSNGIKYFYVVSSVATNHKGTDSAQAAATPRIPPAPSSGYLVQDDFNTLMLNNTIWNDGGGFTLNTTGQNVLLTTDIDGWGAKGDSTGAAGLNSTVGYASFTVATDGTNPIGGNFIVGRDVNFSTTTALLNISLATKGAGTYEVVWNNIGSPLPFTMPISNWSGTVGGNSSVWIVNGITTAPVWGTPSIAPNVDSGDVANRFGFWINNNTPKAIIDNVRIANNLTPAAVVALPVLDISRSGENMILNWSATGFRLQYQETLATAWLDYPLPEGANPPVTVPMTTATMFFRLINP